MGHGDIHSSLRGRVLCSRRGWMAFCSTSGEQGWGGQVYWGGTGPQPSTSGPRERPLSIFSTGQLIESPQRRGGTDRPRPPGPPTLAHHALARKFCQALGTEPWSLCASLCQAWEEPHSPSATYVEAEGEARTKCPRGLLLVQLACSQLWSSPGPPVPMSQDQTLSA
jgi:hypothetical protein